MQRTELFIPEAISWSLRSAVRNLTRGKGLYQAIAIIGTLGLAVGATLAIASIVTCARVKPLPYAHPSELRMIWHAYPGLATPKAEISVPSYALYKSMGAALFTDVAAFAPPRDGNVLFSDDADPISARVLGVTPNIFAVLGVQPAVGRVFINDDAQVVGVLPVILNYDFWREHFGTKEAIGKRITLNGREARVIGVMPHGFQVIESVDMWMPLFFTDRDLAPTQHGNEYLSAIARLRPGTSEAQLKYGLAQVSSAIRTQYPQQYPARFGWYIFASTLTDELTGRYQSELILLSASAFILCIIAMVNVAALLLARSALKAHDFELKVALGSSRPRIVIEIVAEMLLLGILANGIGLLVAQGCLQLFRVHILSHIGQNVPPWNSVGIDIYSALFAIVLDTCVLVALGLIPVRLMSRENGGASANSLARATMGSRHSFALNCLVASDVAIALILTVLSVQLLTTVRKLNTVDPGFSMSGVQTFQIILPRNTYATRVAFDSFQKRLFSELQSHPNIKLAGLTSSLPFQNSEASVLFVVEGQDATAPKSVNFVTCSPSYFSTMEIPQLMGRAFNELDNAGSVPVVLIDQAAVRQFFHDENPIGKRIAFTFEKESDGTPHWREIVGVVGHVRDQTLRDDTDVQFYVPYLQAPPKTYTYIVRGASSNPASMSRDIRDAIKRIDPRLPLHHVRLLDDIVFDSFAITRIAAFLVLFFAVAAGILTVLGIYGTVSYSVLLRRKEIGVRIAFGATRQRILYDVLGRYLKLAVIGIITALPLSIGLGFWIRTALFNVTPYEWLILVAASCLVAALTLMSSYLPAASASRYDPVQVLRVE